MNTYKQKWDKCKELNERARHKEYVEGVSARLIQYYFDPNKSARKAKHLCKFCFYVETSRIGGCAITNTVCATCDTEMSFGNTCTDVFCEKCAEELKMCKHCGARMD